MYVYIYIYLYILLSENRMKGETNSNKINIFNKFIYLYMERERFIHRFIYMKMYIYRCIYTSTVYIDVYIYIYIYVYDSAQEHNKLNNYTITRYYILDILGNSYFLRIYLRVTLQV